MRQPATTLKSWARWYWSYIRRAPGTHVWLLVLLVTTAVVRNASPTTAQRILELHSTNLHYLAVSPVRVLITSAWYIAGNSWLVYFVLFNVFHVPAERRLGTLRWQVIVVVTHVGATYLSEGMLYRAIHFGLAPESARNTLDYGVSYALAGMQGVLTYLIAKPWRYLYVSVLILFYGIALVASRDFTSVGHFDAVILGLGCYPLTRGRPLKARREPHHLNEMV